MAGLRRVVGCDEKSSQYNVPPLPMLVGGGEGGGREVVGRGFFLFYFFVFFYVMIMYFLFCFLFGFCLFT